MPMKFVDSVNIISGEGHSSKFPNGHYLGLILYVQAQKAATAIVEANCPRIRVNFKGKDIVAAGWVNLRKWCDLFNGKPLINDAGAGNLSTYGIFVPFFHAELPSAVSKDDGDTLDIYIEKFAVASCTTAQVDIYGVVDNEVPELYIPSLADNVWTAAAGLQRIDIDMPNITAVMITKPATTACDNLQIEVNGKIEDGGAWNPLEVLANLVARIEATALDVVLFDLVRKGQISDALSDKLSILATGGSGASSYLYQSLEFNTLRTARSSERAQARINAKIVERTTLGASEAAAIAIGTNPGIVRPETAKAVSHTASTEQAKRIAANVAETGA